MSERSRDGAAGATIVLADDHPVVRRGLRMLLEEAGFEVVAEAGDVGAMLRKVLGYKPAVVVLDLNMPGGSSLASIPSVFDASPDTAVVVLTMEDEPEFAREAMRAGALGYVLKEAADGELVEAVCAAVGGDGYLTPQLGARIAAWPEGTVERPDALSDRELEVLKRVALGYTNTQVARELYLSIRTVESHRSHIQHKVRCSSRAELVSYACEHGLLDQTPRGWQRGC